ncbi:hypothetical protein NTE09_001334 [Vibrio mimicus]
MIKIISVLGLVFVAFNANADIQCSGKVNAVLQYADGNVNIHTSYRNEYTVICNTGSSWKGISPDVCRSMISIILSAQAADKDILAYYSGDQFSCSNIPYYGGAPAPVYIGMAK